MQGPVLLPHHIEDLYGSGLSEATVKAAGFRSAASEDVRRILKRQDVGAALEIPYPVLNGQAPFYRFKPDQPPEDGRGRPCKYLTAANAGNRLYIPANLPANTLSDTACPLLITEGEKKALKATQEGFPCIGLAGVWCWKGKDKAGQSVPLPEFEQIAWQGRPVFIVYDSDVSTKLEVQRAEAALAKYLQGRGAQVYVVRLPEGETEGKVGLDDFLVEWGDQGPAQLQVLLDKVRSVKQAIELHVDLDESVEKFPLNALCEPFRRLVEEGATAIQCPPEFIAVPLLVSAGAAAGASRSLRLKEGWEELPAIFAAVIGRPGDAKSPAQEEATRYVYAQERKYRQHYEVQQIAFETERAVWEKNPTGEKPRPPQMQRVAIADATVEAVAQLLYENPRGLLLCRDELTGWAQSLDAYRAGKGGDRQFFLSTWSGAPCSVDRKKQAPLFIDRPCLAVTGALQPDTVRSLLHQDKRDDGFVDRLLFAYPDAQTPQRWSEAIVGAATRERVAALFERLYNLPMGEEGPLPVEINGPAKEVWVEWYEEHQAQLSTIEESLRGVWAKAPRQAARLILISHLTQFADGNGVAEHVDRLSVQRGVALVEYFKSHARRVLGILGEGEGDRTARRLVDWLNRRNNPGVRPRDVVRGSIPGIKGSDEAERYLSALAEKGLGEWQEGHKKASGQQERRRFFLFSNSTLDRSI